MHVVVNLNTLFEYEEIFFLNLFFFQDTKHSSYKTYLTKYLLLTTTCTKY